MSSANNQAAAGISFSQIAARAKNGVIGYQGKMPWHIPEDLKFFKQKTQGHILIMGRKTFASFGNKPLPDRYHIVISRQQIGESHENPNSVIWVNSIAAAFEHAEFMAVQKKQNQVFVIGGAEIYRQTLERCQRVYLTEISLTPEGDAYFADLDPSQWSLTETIAGESCRFLTYQRLAK